MTLPHAFNLAGSDLVKLRQSANFWAERAAAANNAIPETANHSTANAKDDKKEDKKEKEKTSRIGKRRASKPFKRSKTLMESS